jgi:hypothetical protein
MSAYRMRPVLAALTMALALALPPAAHAAVGSDASDAPPRLYRILPDEHPAIDPKKRLLDLRRPIIVTSNRSSAHYRYHLYRGIALIVIGLIGLAWIGYRAYGRRQARAVT